MITCERSLCHFVQYLILWGVGVTESVMTSLLQAHLAGMVTASIFDGKMFTNILESEFSFSFQVFLSLLSSVHQLLDQFLPESSKISFPFPGRIVVQEKAFNYV